MVLMFVNAFYCNLKELKTKSVGTAFFSDCFVGA